MSKPTARLYIQLPLDPLYPNGFSARWFHFARELSRHFVLDVVAVRRIWDDFNAPPERFRPALPLRNFHFFDADLDRTPRPLRGLGRFLRALDSRRVGPTVAGLDRLEPAPDLAIFFLHHLAHYAFLLPPATRSLFVLEEPVVKIEEINRPSRSRNVLHRARRSLMAWLTLQRYRRFVARCGRQGPVVVISDKEKAWFSDRIAPARIHVIQNGVDPDEYRPMPPAPDHDIGVFGDLGQVRNYEPLLDLLRAAGRRDDCRHLRWLLVGRDPVAALRELPQDRFTVTGTVPDTRPFYPRVRVVVSPSRALTGSKSTVLKAWAMQRPVVATPICTSGLPAEPGRNLRLADSDDALLDALLDLLRNPSAADALAAAGRATLVEHCSQHAQAHEFADLCLTTVGAQPVTPG